MGGKVRHGLMDGIDVRTFSQVQESPFKLFNRVKQAFDTLPFDKTTIIICYEEVMLSIAKILKIPPMRPDYAKVWMIQNA